MLNNCLGKYSKWQKTSNVEENWDGLDRAITDTNPEPITSKANNDTNNEVDMGASDVSDAAIKDTNTGSTTGRSNNNTKNEFNVGALDMLDVAIKDTDTNSTTCRVNNNMDAKIDGGVFISRAIHKTDAKFIIDELRKTNTIVKKDVCESNLFWLLLISSRSLAPKIVLLRPLPSG